MDKGNIRGSHKISGVISLLLIFALLASLCAGCAENAGENISSDTADSSDTAVQTEELDSLDARKLVSDDLPERDFEGAQFRTIVQESTPYDIWVESETGDALNDEIYYRNRAIEERFNVVIAETTAIRYDNVSKLVKNSISAGDDAYDLVLGQMETSGADALQGIFMNWYDIPSMDFSKPWYPKSLIENAATVNGKMFSMVSDMCISYAEQTWCIVYDKVHAAKYNIPDVYSIVRDGKWTIDKLSELSKNVYEDLDGNGKADESDFYGFSTSLNGCMILGYFYGFNQRLVEVNDNLEIEMVLNTEKSADIASKLQSVYFESPGTCNLKDTSNAALYGKFKKGTTLFCPTEVQYMYSQFRDYENDYGVVPFPKWDEAQTEYYSVCDAGANILAVPITATNLDMIGTVVEALSAYSWKSVLPTYYDVALNVKSIRDEESIEMLDIVLNNRVIDFAYLYDGWNGWVFTLAEFIKSDKGFASMYASNEKAKLRHYQKVLDFFLED